VITGNLLVSGTTTTINVQNLTISDKDIVVANNVSTSALVDGAGILAGNPTVAYIVYSDAIKGWTTANNFNVGANLTVAGTTTLTGVATAPTAANGTSNTQVATTSFVGSAVFNATSSLGTMSTQNSNNVNITGGSITGITDLAVADGGTGGSSLAANNVLLGNGTSPIQTVAPGTSGNVLVSNGTTWQSAVRKLGLGISGEAWNDVTGSRAFNTTYTNSYSYPIAVSATTGDSGPSPGVQVVVSGVQVALWYWQFNGAGARGGGTAIVPAGATYALNSINGAGVSAWAELY
jgi:hypothetical protein